MYGLKASERTSYLLFQAFAVSEETGQRDVALEMRAVNSLYAARLTHNAKEARYLATQSSEETATFRTRQDDAHAVNVRIGQLFKEHEGNVVTLWQVLAFSSESGKVNMTNIHAKRVRESMDDRGDITQPS